MDEDMVIALVCASYALPALRRASAPAPAPAPGIAEKGKPPAAALFCPGRASSQL
jgi:hypothetical protein